MRPMILLFKRLITLIAHRKKFGNVSIIYKKFLDGTHFISEAYVKWFVALSQYVLVFLEIDETDSRISFSSSSFDLERWKDTQSQIHSIKKNSQVLASRRRGIHMVGLFLKQNPSLKIVSKNITLLSRSVDLRLLSGPDFSTRFISFSLCALSLQLPWQKVKIRWNDGGRSTV